MSNKTGENEKNEASDATLSLEDAMKISDKILLKFDPGILNQSVLAAMKAELDADAVDKTLIDIDYANSNLRYTGSLRGSVIPVDPPGTEEPSRSGQAASSANEETSLAEKDKAELFAGVGKEMRKLGDAFGTVASAFRQSRLTLQDLKEAFQAAGVDRAAQEAFAQFARQYNGSFDYRERGMTIQRTSLPQVSFKIERTRSDRSINRYDELVSPYIFENREPCLFTYSQECDLDTNSILTITIGTSSELKLRLCARHLGIMSDRYMRDARSLTPDAIFAVTLLINTLCGQVTKKNARQSLGRNEPGQPQAELKYRDDGTPNESRRRSKKPKFKKEEIPAISERIISEVDDI